MGCVLLLEGGNNQVYPGRGHNMPFLYSQIPDSFISDANPQQLKWWKGTRMGNVYVP